MNNNNVKTNIIAEWVWEDAIKLSCSCNNYFGSSFKAIFEDVAVQLANQYLNGVELVSSYQDGLVLMQGTEKLAMW